MDKWKIIITPDASKDIYEIYRYISMELLNPDVAKKQINRIVDEIHSLEILPLRYPLYPKEPWFTRGLRSISVDKFIIFYLPDNDKNEIAVLHIFYGGRDIEEFFNII